MRMSEMAIRLSIGGNRRQLIAQLLELPDVSGVYFVWSEGVVVYVGQVFLYWYSPTYAQLRWISSILPNP